MRISTIEYRAYYYRKVYLSEKVLDRNNCGRLVNCSIKGDTSIEIKGFQANVVSRIPMHELQEEC